MVKISTTKIKVPFENPMRDLVIELIRGGFVVWMEYEPGDIGYKPFLCFQKEDMKVEKIDEKENRD